MKVAIVQIAPVFLDKVLTWEKLEKSLVEAAEEGAYLITWGETLIPGYPQWLSPSGGAEFNNADQKKVYARYVTEAMHLMILLSWR